MKTNDVVRLRIDLPAEGLLAGSIGVVVAVFDTPSRAYEVEFADEDGRTIAELALKEELLELVP